MAVWVQLSGKNKTNVLQEGLHADSQGGAGFTKHGWQSEPHSPNTNVMCKRWDTLKRYCSRATGFIQPVHDEVRREFVDGLQLGLHATYPAQDGHGSARASAPHRHSFASCDIADCPAPPHARWRAAAERRDTCGPCPTWGKRVASVSPPPVGTAGADAAVWPMCPERSGAASVDRITHTLGP